MGTFAGIGSDAVKAKTGKGWDEWCTTLDKAGAAKMAHKEIALLLHERHKVPDWWCQMVTVGYEQARGLRVVHQTATGFSASVSRTFGVSVNTLFAAWNDAATRKKWLGLENITVRRATEPKSMRITWSDGKTNVDVGFYSKGDAKSQVAVEHSKLGGKEDVAAFKQLWAAKLDELKALLKG